MAIIFGLTKLETEFLLLIVLTPQAQGALCSEISVRSKFNRASVRGLEICGMFRIKNKFRGNKTHSYFLSASNSHRPVEILALKHPNKAITIRLHQMLRRIGQLLYHDGIVRRHSHS